VKKARAVYGLLSFLFLVAGVGVYFLFRDLGDLLFFARLPIFDFGGSARARLEPSFFADALMFNAAGMLWLVSGIMFFRFLWFYNPGAQKVYVGCFCAIAVALEAAQLSGGVPGTFDPLDLLFMGAGALAEGLAHKVFVGGKTA